LDRLLESIILGGMALAFVAASALPAQLASARPDPEPDNPSIDFHNPSSDLHGLPPAPTGKSTIFGGAITKVDPVRDQFSLQLYGQRSIKILFDERTQVYRDGVRIPLRTLRSEGHASVQTILDGTSVFALSIHILSQSPKGDCQGRVLRYSPQTGELVVRSAQPTEEVKLIILARTPIARAGGTAFTSGSAGLSDLVPGALVSISFVPEQNGRDVASSITVLAVPGTSFTFAGSISYLDVHEGLLELVNPRDGKSYEIHLDSVRTPETESIHLGDNVTIRASYDGSQYEADEITVN
jgi:hypothetical protein